MTANVMVNSMQYLEERIARVEDRALALERRIKDADKFLTIIVALKDKVSDQQDQINDLTEKLEATSAYKLKEYLNNN